MRPEDDLQSFLKELNFNCGSVKEEEAEEEIKLKSNLCRNPLFWFAISISVSSSSSTTIIK
jgi:hypothetical protein